MLFRRIDEGGTRRLGRTACINYSNLFLYYIPHKNLFHCMWSFEKVLDAKLVYTYLCSLDMRQSSLVLLLLHMYRPDTE